MHLFELVRLWLDFSVIFRDAFGFFSVLRLMLFNRFFFACTFTILITLSMRSNKKYSSEIFAFQRWTVRRFCAFFILTFIFLSSFALNDKVCIVYSNIECFSVIQIARIARTPNARPLFVCVCTLYMCAKKNRVMKAKSGTVCVQCVFWGMLACLFVFFCSFKSLQIQSICTDCVENVQNEVMEPVQKQFKMHSVPDLLRDLCLWEENNNRPGFRHSSHQIHQTQKLTIASWLSN